MAQMVKHLPTVQETQVQSLGQEDLLEKGMATHCSTLAWKIPWMEEPGRLQSLGLKESDTTERFTFFLSFFLSFREERDQETCCAELSSLFLKEGEGRWRVNKEGVEGNNLNKEINWGKLAFIELNLFRNSRRIQEIWTHSKLQAWRI